MTSRGQFPRSNVTGARPASLYPGSFAVNWRDKVIWVGDASGSPIRFTRKVENYNQSLAYAADDFVIIGADLWRALTTIAAGAPFNQASWQRLSDVGRNEISEPYASEIYSGGVVTRQSANTLSVTAGQGVVVNNTTPAQVLSTPISWSNFSLPVVPLATPVTIIGINSAGAAVHISTSEYTPLWRRQNIALATVLWTTSGTVDRVRDISIRAGGDGETLRDGYFINGGSYRANGGRVAVVPNSLNLKHSAGEVFALGARWRSAPFAPNDISVLAASAFLMTPASATQALGAASAIVQTTFYDPNGAGTVLPMPAGQFSIQYLFSSSDMQSFFLQYGQTAYPTQFDAVSAINEDQAAFKIAIPGIAAMLLAAVITQKGVANLGGAVILNAAPYGDPFAGTGSASAAGADYYLRDGSRPLTGDMNAAGFEILNAVLDGGTF